MSDINRYKYLKKQQILDVSRVIGDIYIRLYFDLRLIYCCCFLVYFPMQTF